MPPSGRSGCFSALPYIVTRDPGHGARATIWRWYYTHFCCCLKALNPKELQGLFLISPPTFLELSPIFKVPLTAFLTFSDLNLIPNNKLVARNLCLHRVQLDKSYRQKDKDRQPRPQLRHDLVEDNLRSEYFAGKAYNKTRSGQGKAEHHGGLYRLRIPTNQ